MSVNVLWTIKSGVLVTLCNLTFYVIFLNLTYFYVPNLFISALIHQHIINMNTFIYLLLVGL